MNIIYTLFIMGFWIMVAMTVFSIAIYIFMAIAGLVVMFFAWLVDKSKGQKRRPF